MSRALKIHAVASHSDSKWVMQCGKVGWATTWANEFDTAKDDRFEAAPMGNNRTVTCKACLAAIARRPPSNVGAAFHAGLL